MEISTRFISVLSLLISISLLLSYGFTNSLSQDKNRHNNFYGHNFMQFTHQNDGANDSDRWMSVMTFLSTLFAVFFVYTGFKIDATREKVDESEKRILEIESKVKEDILEYSNQLHYAISYAFQKQYDKAIDALTVLRNEHFVLKDNLKINTCNFLLAHCYYERGTLTKSKDDLSFATNYINEAIEDETHPYKIEIIEAFNKLNI